MNVYDAIIKAANHIEQHPEGFNFFRAVVPGCGSPGCALGWIGHFLGFEKGADVVVATNEALGFCQRRGEHAAHPFYDRMNDLQTGLTGYSEMDNALHKKNWRHVPSMCAGALRLYADKYHGNQKPKEPAREDLRVVSWADCPWLPNRTRA